MEKLRLPSNELLSSQRMCSRRLEDWEYEPYARTIRASRKDEPRSDESLLASPSKSRWAAVLKKARDELERKTGEVIPHVLPKQAEIHLNPWNYGIKKKGRNNAAQKWKVYTVQSSPSPYNEQSQSHSDLLKFNRPAEWRSWEGMKRSTTKKHPKPPVYDYTPLPRHVDIYENPNELPYRRRRLIISGHRFHQRHELQTIHQDYESSWKNPRLLRVEPMVSMKKSQGPLPVEPAPIPSTKSTWAMVVATNKPLPAIPKATVTSAKPESGGCKKVSVKPSPATTTTTDAKSTTVPKGPYETSLPTVRPTIIELKRKEMQNSMTPTVSDFNKSSSAIESATKKTHAFKLSATGSTTPNIPQHAPLSVSTNEKKPDRHLTRTNTKSWAQVVLGDQDDVLDKTLDRIRAGRSAAREKRYAEMRKESAAVVEKEVAQQREEAVKVAIWREESTAWESNSTQRRDEAIKLAKWREESASWESNLAQRREEAAEVDRKLTEAGLKLPDLRPKAPISSYSTDPSQLVLLTRLKKPSSSSVTKVSSVKTPSSSTDTKSSTTAAPLKRAAHSPPNDVTPKKKMRMAKNTSSTVNIAASTSSSSTSSTAPTVPTATTTTAKPTAWREIVGIMRRD